MRRCGFRWSTRSVPEIFEPATRQLNRAHLARRAFSDPATLTRLNGLVHPRVGDDFRDLDAGPRRRALSAEGSRADFRGRYRQKPGCRDYRGRAGRSPHCPRPGVAIRTALPPDVQAIIGKQLPEAERQRRADLIVWNDDQQLVIPQVLKLDAHFRNLANLIA